MSGSKHRLQADDRSAPHTQTASLKPPWLLCAPLAAPDKQSQHRAAVPFSSTSCSQLGATAETLCTHVLGTGTACRLSTR